MTENEKIIIEHHKRLFYRLWERLDNITCADICLEWLENYTDFFTAPASTKYHGSRPGGLLIHSIAVCQTLMELLTIYGKDAGIEQESAILVALLHDVCKCNYYKETTKRQKNADGKWEDVRGYTVEDDLPMGHGEKSLYLILQTGLELTNEEAAAIRWHMGAYQDQDKLGTMSKAFDQYPLALFLHIADMIASHFIEKEAADIAPKRI